MWLRITAPRNFHIPICKSFYTTDAIAHPKFPRQNIFQKFKFLDASKSRAYIPTCTVVRLSAPR